MTEYVSEPPFPDPQDDSYPDPDFEGLSWQGICDRLDWIENWYREQAYLDWETNMQYEQWYQENQGWYRDY
jgi:hypothetical protein